MLTSLLILSLTASPPVFQGEGYRFGISSAELTYPLILEGTVVSHLEVPGGAPKVLVAGFPRSGANFGTKDEYILLPLLKEMPSVVSGMVPVVTIPPLEVGETGFWAIAALPGASLALGHEIYGRKWPVIRGRDAEYQEVAAWVDLLQSSPESYHRRIDVKGEKYPAPQPREWRPGDAPMRVFTPGAASGAGAHKLLPPAPPVPDRPWGMNTVGWIVALVGAVGFGFLTGLGCARRGRGT